MEKPFEFPIGYHKYSTQKVFNYQLNRFHSIGMARHEDCMEMGKRIKCFDDWKNVTQQSARIAEEEGRLLNAAIYYRASEFYTMGDEKAKEIMYDSFIKTFYKAVKSEKFVHEFIPYESGELPVLRFNANGDKKGTILLHGGFDSFQEEWFFIMKYLSQNGYEVIGFEGPGQGHMLIKQNIPLDYRWERPVKCILDYYEVDKATLFGLSMGGWFCLRAAAYEPRIASVIPSGHAVDYSRIPPDFARNMMMFFIKHMRKYTANSFVKVSKKKGIQGWQTYQLSNITRKNPLEAFEYSLNMNEENLASHQIKAHVLYLTGKDDHFVPYKMHDWQVKLFTGCKSFADKVYTRETQANNHCQVGNIGLMLDDILLWLTSIM